MSDQLIINYFLEIMRKTPSHQALLSSHFSATYDQLLESYEYFIHWIEKHNIPPGAVVSFDGDYSPSSISLSSSCQSVVQMNNIGMLWVISS